MDRDLIDALEIVNRALAERRKKLGWQRRVVGMSADRWGVCPRCQAVREQRIATGAAAMVKAAYGTVPPEEYILLTGVQPADADRLIESIEAAIETRQPEVLPGPVGWAVGYPGGTFSGPVWHHWSGRYMSDCHRWKADRVGPQFRPFLETEQACNNCEAVA